MVMQEKCLQFLFDGLRYVTPLALLDLRDFSHHPSIKTLAFYPHTQGIPRPQVGTSGLRRQQMEALERAGAGTVRWEVTQQGTTKTWRAPSTPEGGRLPSPRLESQI